MVRFNRLVIAAVVLGLLAACGRAAPPSGGPDASPTVAAEWRAVGVWTGGRLEFRLPEGVAVDSQGLIYIADTGNHRVQVLRADGSYVTGWGGEGTAPGQFAGHYSGPSGIAVDGQDNIYVVDSAAGRVQKFTSAGEFIAAWGEPGTGPGQFKADDHFGPSGIALDAAGNVYVADTSNGRIQKFTADGAFVAEWPTLAPGDEYASPVWLAISGDRIYVADGFGGHVLVYGLDGASIAVWPDAGFERLGGVAVSPAGEVFVADKGRVRVFTPDGALLRTIADAEGLSGPEALAFDRDGRLIAVDKDQNHVALYAPAGSPLASAPTAGPLPTVGPGVVPAVAPAPGALTAENASAIAALATLGKGPIRAVAFSGDGRRVAVGASTGVSLYDGATLEPQAEIATDWPARALAFAPDGQRLAIALDTGAVLLADLAAGGALRPLDGANGYPFNLALAFSPDGATLASASSETVKLWRVADGALLHTLSGHENSVEALEFSADGTTLLSVDPGLDGVEQSEPVAARRWNVQSGALIETIETSLFIYGRITIDIAPDAASLLITSNEGKVGMWRVESGALTQARELAADGMGAAFASDGGAIIVSRADGSTELYDAGGELLRTLDAAASPARALAASAGGARIVAGGDDQIVRLWPDGGAPREVGGFSAGVTAAALAPDGTTLAAGTDSGRLVLWDLATQTLLWSVQAHSWATSSVAFSPDGKMIASGGDFMVELKNFPSESLRLWNAADGALIRSLEGHAYTVTALDFSPDGALLASSSSDGDVTLWQSGDGAFIKKLTADESFGDLAFTPDGRELIGATVYDSEQDDIWVWQLATGEFARGIAVEEDDLYSALALAADGATLVSSRGAVISVRQPADGAVSASFEAGDTVLSMAVSPDGRLLAVGLYDGGVELWDLATGNRLVAPAAHTSYVNTVAFTPDGARLITASSDGSIIVWGVR